MKLITSILLLTLLLPTHPTTCPTYEVGNGWVENGCLRPQAVGERNGRNKLLHRDEFIVLEKITKTAGRLINNLSIIRGLECFSSEEVAELNIIFNKMDKMAVEFIPDGLIEVMSLRDGLLSLDNAHFNVCAEHFLGLSDIELEVVLLHEATHLLLRQFRRRVELENILNGLPKFDKAVYSEGVGAQKRRKSATKAMLLHLKNECEAYEAGIEYIRLCSPNYFVHTFAHAWYGKKSTYLSQSIAFMDMAHALEHRKRRLYVILVLYSGSTPLYRQVNLRWLFSMQSPTYRDTPLWNIRLRDLDMEFERQFEEWVCDEFAEVYAASDLPLTQIAIESAVLRPLAAGEQP